MSLQPQSVEPVPANTAKIARAAFRKGNIYIKMRDELGTLFEDEDFAALYGATLVIWEKPTLSLSFTPSTVGFNLKIAFVKLRRE